MRNKLNIIYQLNNLPVLQNRVYDTQSEAINCTVGNMCLVQDLETGLVYNHAFDNNLMHYDENYQNEQALSQSFRDHLDDVTSIILKTLGKHNLLEIGCGKGFFLEHLLCRDFDVIGVDPSYQGMNNRIIKQYYSKALNLGDKNIILRHVLEHIQHPLGFLQGLNVENGGQGKVYIEVPCFDWIINNNAWFDIYYEHVNYFRLSDFEQLFNVIYESGTLFNGQYIYVVAELSSIQQPKFIEKNLLPLLSFSRDILTYEKNNTFKNIIWGASSKGVIYSLVLQQNNQTINAVVDINPMKQGKYLPLTGIKVSTPEKIMNDFDESSNIYVMNSNYSNEIKKITNNKYTYMSIDNG